MSNAERILLALDSSLDGPVDLTLYGRAALQLGFDDPMPEYAISRDVDAVLWLGQAEELATSGNFWEAVEQVNRQFADQELYVSHLFEENQVVLTPDWRRNRMRVPGAWGRLALHRLGDRDLLLTKLMRDDPIDLSDARFIIERARISKDQLVETIRCARIPDIPEISEQFDICSKRLMSEVG